MNNVNESQRVELLNAADKLFTGYAAATVCAVAMELAVRTALVGGVKGLEAFKQIAEAAYIMVEQSPAWTASKKRKKPASKQ